MHRLNLNIPSPIEIVSNHGFSFNLHVKREDLIHPFIKGNKYRKLKYNLALMQHKCVISFGGAYSNHIHALAALCKIYNFPSAAIIRGEKVQNEVLNFCEANGMKLYFVDRVSYREKEKSDVIKSILNQFENPLIIPEGGSNDLALNGVKELVYELPQIAIPYDFIAVSAGTGCTAAGILMGINELNLSSQLLVFSALKGKWMADEISKFSKIDKPNFICTDAYSLGGYAKVNNEYLDFIKSFFNATNVPLDRIYNGKLIFGLADLDRQGFFKKEDRVLWINSGGV